MKIHNKIFSAIVASVITANTVCLTSTTAFAGFGQQRMAYESELMQYVFKGASTAVKDIAAGKRASAIVDIKLPAGMRSNQNSFNTNTLLDALITEFPYELYWFDVTKGIICSTSTYMIGNIEYYDSVCVKLSVNDDYKTATEFTVDQSKTKATTTAIATAKTIINANKNKSDYDKLYAYKNAICELVSYDSDAASHTSGQCYGDSWQLIYVFDNEPTTNVVCEGYAKAFQYLCDNTVFNDPTIKCATASGTFEEEGKSVTNHMWNIVSIGSNSYLTDITNCDSGQCGADNLLFMRKAVESDSNNCTICLNKTGKSHRDLFYSYNTDTCNVLDDDFRTIAREKHQISVTAEPATKPDEDVDTNKDTDTKPEMPAESDNHEHTMGDVNKDGWINANDALQVLKHSVGINILIDELAADMNADGYINAADALIILKTSVGIL